MIAARASRRREATFDLTPLIDVVLLLIIFFMMTSQFEQLERSPIDLPRERGGAAGEGASPTVVVDVDSEGAVKVAGEAYDLEQLSAFVSRSRAGGGEVDVLVRADRACTTAKLNAVAWALMETGLRRWKLATTGTGGPEPGG